MLRRELEREVSVMLIEIHMLQNHAPSNLNRDDTGSPKDCLFGGVRRARISSQCLKRSIRKSAIFQEEVGADLATRTRRLPELVRERLLARGLSSHLADIAEKKASGFGNKEGTEQAKTETAQTMFLAPADIEAIAAVLYEEAVRADGAKAFEKVLVKDLQKSATLKGWRPITPDIALFGRMITSDAFRDVEAAVQVAHALSTHKMEHEFDYFTAVDDLRDLSAAEEDKGADMIGDVEFNSACYYKYFSIDVGGLLENLAGKGPAAKASTSEMEQYEAVRRDAARLVRRTVLAFLKSATFTSPSGKQNSFAAHQLPDGILVEVRDKPIPVSFANAFVKPAAPSTQTDLVQQSLLQFKEHVENLTTKFSLSSSARFWFTTRSTEITGTIPCDTLSDLLTRLEAALEGWRDHG